MYIIILIVLIFVTDANSDIRSEIFKNINAEKTSNSEKVVSSNKNVPKVDSKVDVANTNNVNLANKVSTDKDKTVELDKTAEVKKVTDTNVEQCISVENAYISDGKKVAFLTFDDGPSSENTIKILDILKSNNIKATFFIVGSAAEKNPAILKRVVNDGHAIANHTYSHDYNIVYSSVDVFMGEIKKTEDIMKKILGNTFFTRIVRFPGGSFEASKAPFRQELVKQGYIYVDWNAITGDGEGTNIAPTVLVSRLVSTAGNQNHIVALMHDSPSKQTSVDALPGVIESLKSRGYEFATLK